MESELAVAIVSAVASTVLGGAAIYIAVSANRFSQYVYTRDASLADTAQRREVAADLLNWIDIERRKPLLMGVTGGSGPDSSFDELLNRCALLDYNEVSRLANATLTLLIHARDYDSTDWEREDRLEMVRSSVRRALRLWVDGNEDANDAMEAIEIRAAVVGASSEE